MLQQLIAILVILAFIARIIHQRQKGRISRNEFLVWLAFWIMAGVAISFIKQIDRFVAGLGFSSRGIDVLLYLAVALLFYLYLRLRLKIAKMDRDITELTRHQALNNKKQ